MSAGVITSFTGHRNRRGRSKIGPYFSMRKARLRRRWLTAGQFGLDGLL